MKLHSPRDMISGIPFTYRNRNRNDRELKQKRGQWKARGAPEKSSLTRQERSVNSSIVSYSSPLDPAKTLIRNRTRLPEKVCSLVTVLKLCAVPVLLCFGRRLEKERLNAADLSLIPCTAVTHCVSKADGAKKSDDLSPSESAVT